ncbi:hypothetical protein JL100_035835 (plasmid) [Skermanella mucosa]|uniref:anti-sigma factor family protein n=1 Tax=Skermanella mucosa TaxID=1789672 RepID=UPI00192CA1C8|nr:hypothetical protein [Skermanella mucosa]UEM25155.1 hypothetical protein JL100_035835 [Skermanella mucosa]
MNDHIDDMMLGAYVDGELHPALIGKIEAFLAGNEEARRKVGAFREINAFLRACGSDLRDAA